VQQEPEPVLQVRQVPEPVLQVRQVQQVLREPEQVQQVLREPEQVQQVLREPRRQVSLVPVQVSQRGAQASVHLQSWRTIHGPLVRFQNAT
jgi:hypothetical protein